MIRKKSMALSVTDPFIITRVRQYLEENVHQTYVDVASMARCLQERYEEYANRKSVPFRSMVEQAYKVVLHSYGLDSNPSSEENDASDIELMDTTTTNSNHMNKMLTDLYSKPSNKNKPQPVNDNELIDIISSDESGDEKQQTAVATPINNNKNGTKKLPTQATQQLAMLRDVTVKVKGKSSDAPAQENTDKRNVNVAFGPQKPESILKKRKPSQNEQRAEQQNLQAAKSKSSVTHHKTDNVATSSAVGSRGKRFKKEVTIQHSQFTFRDMGGVEKILKELCELLFHIKHPEIYHTIGLSPPRGILLHGPPGCGKTLLAHAVAGQLKIGLIEVPATELIAGISGESEERIREIFEQALAVAPCVLFIDDIDAISVNRANAQKDMERRVVSQLISSMDNLSKHENGEHVMVIGATTRPECLDPALRRVGRFDHEIALGVPDRKEREEILMIICDVLSLKMPFDYAKIAELTPGYVGADLTALATRAASIAVKRKYMKKMRDLRQQHNIPVVDLIDEVAVDGNLKNNNENQEQRNVKEASSQDKDKDNDEKLEEENQKEELNGNLSELNKSGETLQSENIDENKMEVEAEVHEEPKENEGINNLENSLLTVSSVPNTETAVDNETIDVDELSSNALLYPDKVTEKSSLDADGTNTIIQKDKELQSDAEIKSKQMDIGKTNRRSPALFEMIHLLNSNIVQLEDCELEDICITMEDFEEALKYVQPSAKREGFITIPDVTWDDIGSLRDIREELQLAILAPVKYPEKMEALGLNAPSGILLCGPPGCGKTLLAKAIANEAGINFISVKGPELMNMYVGESERAVRTCFQRARNSAPCVVFFDEFDSLCPKRSDSMEGGSGNRVVNQLLTEMDGIEERKGVFLMAATNRPDIIDPAILRPGRLDTILFVGLPAESDRIEILNALTKSRTRPVLADDVDLSEIAKQTDGFTGADLAGLVRQASLLALKESLLIPDFKNEDLKVSNKNLINAVLLTKPSVSLEDRKLYDKLKMKYAAPRKLIE